MIANIALALYCAIIIGSLYVAGRYSMRAQREGAESEHEVDPQDQYPPT